MAYATADHLFQYLTQETSNATTRAAFEVILDRATAIIDGALQPIVFGAWPGSAAVRRVQSYGGSMYLTLPPHQLGSVNQLTYGGTTVPSTQYEETAEGNLAIIPDTVTYPVLWGNLGQQPMWQPGFYTATATWGYGPVPESIVQLTLELATNIWRERASGLFQTVLGADDGAALRYVGGLNSTQRAIIANIRSRYLEVAV